jgi:hypothetical protein
MTCLIKYCFTFCMPLFFLAGPISNALSQQLPARDFIFQLDMNTSALTDSLCMQSISSRQLVDNHFSVMDFEFHVIEPDDDTLNLVFHTRGNITSLSDGKLHSVDTARINVGVYIKSPINFKTNHAIPLKTFSAKNYSLFQLLCDNQKQLFNTDSQLNLFAFQVGKIESQYQNQTLRTELDDKGVVIRSRYFCVFMLPNDFSTFAEKFNIDWAAIYRTNLKELDWINLKKRTNEEIQAWLWSASLLLDTSYLVNQSAFDTMESSDKLPDNQKPMDTLTIQEMKLQSPEIPDSTSATELPIVNDKRQEIDTPNEDDTIQESDGNITEAETFIEPSHPYFTFTGSFDDGMDIIYSVDGIGNHFNYQKKAGVIKSGILIPEIKEQYAYVKRLIGTTLVLKIITPKGFDITQTENGVSEQLNTDTLVFEFTSKYNDKKAIPLEILPWKYFNILYLSLHEVKDRIQIRDTLEKLMEDFDKNQEGFLIYLSDGERPILADNPDGYDRRIYQAIHTLRPGLPSKNFDVPQLKRYVTENEVFINHKGIRVWYFASERIDKLFMEDIFDERFINDFTSNEFQVQPLIKPFILNN